MSGGHDHGHGHGGAEGNRRRLAGRCAARSTFRLEAVTHADQELAAHH